MHMNILNTLKCAAGRVGMEARKGEKERKDILRR